MTDDLRTRIRGLYWRTQDLIAGRMPRCNHGFAPDQGIGLWCPGCGEDAADD